jgi:DNA-binding response OmpR family regulator
MDMSIKILVVEDDNDINQLLCSVVRKSGYTPQSAFSGTEALLYLKSQKWSMVLLDLMLPGLTGEELLKEIRNYSSCPVIIISAKGEQKTKITALRTGADDYITKPFDLEEVSARIDSHLRRYQQFTKTKNESILKHKDIKLDLEAKTVSLHEQVLSLTAREYEILLLLMSSPKKIFSKANVFESIWGDTYLGDDNTINVHMSNLRNKLSKANPNEEYIETIWGMGYRLKT